MFEFDCRLKLKFKVRKQGLRLGTLERNRKFLRYINLEKWLTQNSSNNSDFLRDHKSTFAQIREAT